MGQPQLRLRFKKDDNDDTGADYLKIFSGDAGESKCPRLIVEYSIPWEIETEDRLLCNNLLYITSYVKLLAE